LQTRKRIRNRWAVIQLLNPLSNSTSPTHRVDYHHHLYLTGEKSILLFDIGTSSNLVNLPFASQSVSFFHSPPKVSSILKTHQPPRRAFSLPPRADIFPTQGTRLPPLAPRPPSGLPAASPTPAAAAGGSGASAPAAPAAFYRPPPPCRPKPRRGFRERERPTKWRERASRSRQRRRARTR
jgi:hypothetical protein